MCPTKYYQIMKNSKDKKIIRYQMVVYGQKNGIKPAARAFSTTTNTIRRWMIRYEKEGYDGLEDKSKRPKNSPKKISEDLKEKIIKLKGKYKRVGAEQVKYLEDLEVCGETIKRVWRKEGFSNKRRRKHETKKNLREVKKKIDFLGFVCEDTKELCDIPEYYEAMTLRGTPKIQYTFRDVPTGMVYLGFSDDKALNKSTLFAKYMNNRLGNLGMDLSKTTRQTDNGSEYIGSWNAKSESGYTLEIEKIKGQTHQTIPPKRHTYQADVETFHDIIEREWYEIENFKDRQDFIKKAYLYQIYFNTKRINTYKEKKTPIELAREKIKNLDIKIALIPPIDLDELERRNIENIKNSDFFDSGVSHVLTYPFFCFYDLSTIFFCFLFFVFLLLVDEFKNGIEYSIIICLSSFWFEFLSIPTNPLRYKFLFNFNFASISC